ncbi:hypothetical protein HMPREF9466_01674 [Fusobacterium necrophorum subsp. funduliforme 1_1_36S]|nr:hypothetical protein HMPREF9466_01674 [Fusobacterium necrophorum subsp. funduliforme 1_1_36S]
MNNMEQQTQTEGKKMKNKLFDLNKEEIDSELSILFMGRMDKTLYYEFMKRIPAIYECATHNKKMYSESLETDNIRMINLLNDIKKITFEFKDGVYSFKLSPELEDFCKKYIEL